MLWVLDLVGSSAYPPPTLTERSWPRTHRCPLIDLHVNVLTRPYKFDPLELRFYKSLVVRKPAFCICENEDADQLRSNCTADQRLCFRYTDSTIPLLPKSEISRLYPSSVAVQTGLCRTWSETPKTGFLTTVNLELARVYTILVISALTHRYTRKNRLA